MPLPALERMLGHLTDAALVARVLAGDHDAFEVIMRRHNQLLFRTARSILRTDAEAEDAVQEAYLRAWRAMATFRAESKLSTWLVRIVTRTALDRGRNPHADIIPLDIAMVTNEDSPEGPFRDDPALQPESLAYRQQVRRLLESRIDLLPEAFRTVFMLRAVEEWSVEEVAQALELPEATVRSRYFRAKGLLREGLASQMDASLREVFSFDGARCDRIVAGVRAKLKD